MEFNFNPKASDVYQVTKAPTNKYDAMANAVSAVCGTLLTLGIVGGAIGFLVYLNNDSRKASERRRAEYQTYWNKKKDDSKGENGDES